MSRAQGPGPRSVEALRWLARVEVAGVEPLWCALGVRRAAGYSHVARLRRAGLVERTYDPDGTVVAITGAGRREVRADRREVRSRTHGSGLRHARAVSWMAALASLREREWVSDLEARSFETNDSTHIAASTACPSNTNYSGLLARTVLGSGGIAPSAAAYGEWAIQAPSGTTITRVRLRRWLGMEAGSGWTLYGRQADGTTLAGETCTPAIGTDECNVGGYATGLFDRLVDTTAIAYGFRCPTSGAGCSTGATIHHARAAIYSANVTITDPTSPTVGTPTGDLVRASGFHKGSESVTFNGTDALGLSARRLYVDGDHVASDAPACDFTRLVPCSNPSSSVTLSANLDSLSDGSHTVQVGVVDAAGNETRSASTSIVVDHTAPAGPQDLQALPRMTTYPGFTAWWSEPTNQVAPISAAHWRLCLEGSASPCSAGTTTGTTLSGTLPAYGRYTLFVALEDAAANRGGEVALALAYEPPAPPPPPTPTPTPPTATPTPPSATPTPAPTATPTPAPRANPRLKVTSATLKRSSRTLTASGTAAASATGKVRFKLTYRVGGKARSKTFTATLKHGRFSARTRLSSTDSRRASKLSLSVTYAGNTNYSGASTRRTVKVRR